jgi:hypothetical protein
LDSENHSATGLNHWRRRDSKSQSCKGNEGKESQLDKREHDYEGDTRRLGATQSLGSEENEPRYFIGFFRARLFNTVIY